MTSDIIVRPKTGLAQRARKLTKDTVDVFIRALETPTTVAVAAGVAGVSEKTIFRWLSAAQEEDCDDEVLQYLLTKYSETMNSGKRSNLMKQALEQSEVDPRVTIKLLDALIPGMSQPKTSKVEISAAPANPDAGIPYHLATDEELEVLNHAERIKTRLRSLL